MENGAKKMLLDFVRSKFYSNGLTTFRPLETPNMFLQISLIFFILLGANVVVGDVVAEMNTWNADISAADRTAKYCKMATSPFIFYRGTNHLFWKDFAGDYRLSQFGNSKTVTWLQGDLHVENFGAFENDQGDVIYSINDYDESIVADYQYDIWRMAISIVLWMNDLGETSSSFQSDVIDAFSESYLDSMATYRGTSAEMNKKFTASNTYGKLDNFLSNVEQNEGRVNMLKEWCSKDSNGIRRFDLTHEDLEAAASAKKTEIKNAFSAYKSTTSLSGQGTGAGQYFYIKDIAKRLNAGTGSLGKERYYVLIEGPSTSQDDDVILDMKLQSAPTPYTYLGASTQTKYNSDFGSNHARRHMVGYKALIDEVDNNLGWVYLASSGYFSVRERSAFKKTFDPAYLGNDGDFVEMAEQWGAVLATAHARADQDSNPYVVYSVDKQIDDKTSGLHSVFRDLVRQIAFEYASQVQNDWNTFLANLLPPNCPVINV